jgi:hypothetical protein
MESDMSILAECIVLSGFAMSVLIGAAFFTALWQHEMDES